MLKTVRVFLVATVTICGADLSGVWDFTVETPRDGTGMPVVTINQDGETLTGKYNGRLGNQELHGTIVDRAFEFAVKTPQGDLHFKGTLDPAGKKIAGTFELPNHRSGGPFSGERR